MNQFAYVALACDGLAIIAAGNSLYHLDSFRGVAVGVIHFFAPIAFALLAIAYVVAGAPQS